MVKHVARLFRKKDEERSHFEKLYGRAHHPIGVKAGDDFYTTVGGEIYCQTRAGAETFLHVIHDHALLFLGTAFLDEEEAKPFADRHPAVQWMNTLVEYTHTPQYQKGTAPGIGAGAAWYRFAYDLFTIRDNAKLQARMKQRLLAKKDFQSSRYELWVAALCITAGFDIDYEDECDNTSTHPEFVATDRDSGVRIAVEAKSRHRRGVKGFDGGQTTSLGEKVDIRKLVLDAFKKANDIPFYVFIDVNLPPAFEEVFESWLDELHATIRDLEVEGYGDASPANIIFITNDPSHFLEHSPLGGSKGDDLWIVDYVAERPRVTHPSIDVRSRLRTAFKQRVAPPIDFPPQ